MVLGIDLDSTIARIDEPWLDRLNEVRGTQYKPGDWTDWDLNFLKESEMKVFFDLFTPDIYDVVEPYPDAPEVIHEFSKIPGLELRCVTTNPSRNEAAFV